MKKFLILFLGLLAIGCSQKKAVVQVQQETQHRYTTVYEGNKIISYEKQEEKEESLVISNRNQIEVPSKNTELVVPKAEKLEALPALAQRKVVSKYEFGSGYKLRRGIFASVKQAKENSAKSSEAGESNLGFGFAGFMLILGSFVFAVVALILAFGTLEYTAVILALLSVAAFVTGIVMSILGIVRKKSQVDLVFGIVGLSLILLSIFLSVLGTL